MLSCQFSDTRECLAEARTCLAWKEPAHSTNTVIVNGRDQLAGDSLGKPLSLSELVSFTVTTGQSGRSCAKGASDNKATLRSPTR